MRDVERGLFSVLDGKNGGLFGEVVYGADGKVKLECRMVTHNFCALRVYV